MDLLLLFLTIVALLAAVGFAFAGVAPAPRGSPSIGGTRRSAELGARHAARSGRRDGRRDRSKPGARTGAGRLDVRHGAWRVSARPAAHQGSRRRRHGGDRRGGGRDGQPRSRSGADGQRRGAAARAARAHVDAAFARRDHAHRDWPGAQSRRVAPRPATSLRWSSRSIAAGALPRAAARRWIFWCSSRATSRHSW